MSEKRGFLYYTGFDDSKEIDAIHAGLAGNLEDQDFQDGFLSFLEAVSKLNAEAKSSSKMVQYRYLASVICLQDDGEIINQFLVQRITT